MSTTTRAGFTATHGIAGCVGSRHRHDPAKVGTCDGCGAYVAKTSSGRIVGIHFAGTGAATFACWDQNHECDAQRATVYTESQAARIASGDMIKGQTVTVVKGRKVPVGTTGTVTWIGEDNYGNTRVGIKTAEGDMHFTAQNNLEVTP